jgi:C_GCAxxG_C_C family probable redox protein
MMGRREDTLLRAFTSLQGGVVGSGSTCGVVTGGAVGLALMHDSLMQEKGVAGEAAVLSLVGEYANWFERNFGSCFCRERTGVNFRTLRGQLRHFIPGDKVGKCLWHSRAVARHMYSCREKDLVVVDIESNEAQGEPIHCAQAVLRRIREETGIGDSLLERLSFVFDGGVGFRGGVCGALAGSIMGVNLLAGMNIRDMSYWQTLKACGVGHINMLTEKPIGAAESFSLGKPIVHRFRDKAGATECAAITEKEFSDWTGFQRHISSSDKCKGLIEFAAAEACKVMKSM